MGAERNCPKTEDGERSARLMALIKKNAAERQAQEKALHKALRAWYTSPGIQRELRKRENEAMRTVLEVLARRVAAAEGGI